MPPNASAEVPTLWAFLFRLAGVALVVLAVRGLVVPEDAAASAPSPESGPA